MLTDTHKIIIIVLSPIGFFALIISLGLVYRRRTNRASNKLVTPSSNNDTETTQEIPAQDSSHGHISGLGPNIALPQYEDKVIHVRRLSAYPEMDEIRRVSSVCSTLGDATTQQQARDRRGSAGMIGTLVITEMEDGYVGVERRPSVPNTGAVRMSRCGSVYSVVSPVSASTTIKQDPGSPHDKRFSMHLSYIIPPTAMSPVDPNQPMETLTSPLPPPISATPLPPLSTPRSPMKLKHRPDSIDLAIARSTTIVSVTANTGQHPVPTLPSLHSLPTTAPLSQLGHGPQIESLHSEPGQIFKGWEGFSPSPPTAPLSSGSQLPLPPRRSSLRGVRAAKVFAEKNAGGRAEERDGMVDGTLGQDEKDHEVGVVLPDVSPSRIPLPESPASSDKLDSRA